MGGREAATVGETNAAPNKPASSAIFELSRAVVVAATEVVASVVGRVIVMDGVECEVPEVGATMPLVSSAIFCIASSILGAGSQR